MEEERLSHNNDGWMKQKKNNLTETTSHRQWGKECNRKDNIQ